MKLKSFDFIKHSKYLYRPLVDGTDLQHGHRSGAEQCTGLLTRCRRTPHLLFLGGILFIPLPAFPLVLYAKHLHKSPLSLLQNVANNWGWHEFCNDSDGADRILQPALTRILQQITERDKKERICESNEKEKN